MIKKIEEIFKSICWQKSLMLVASIFLALNALANPVVDNIAAGNVSIQQSPNSTVINQASPNAIINWQSFNIGAQESTHFQQPVGGVALNRISPMQGASEIYGRLTATGQIILANPAGIYFGPNAYVNVGGLIATTASITDQNFLSGNYIFTQDPFSTGSIINQGTIIAAQHGLVALIGGNVRNDGMIQANLGHVVLASGGAFTVSFANNDMINFSVNGESRGGVTNTGSLIANGGSVLISARSAQSVLDNVINLQGVVQAQSVSAHKGEIIISGDKSAGVVRVASKLKATGKNAGEKGGTVKVTGYNILLDSPTLIDVSGDAGAGDIYVGGNYQGKGPLPNANAVYVAQGAQLKADALSTGNGGNIILWSDYVTRAYGDISARGGALSGDGGFVETSSHIYLDVSDINVNTGAVNGNAGSWLLDPWALTISFSGNNNINTIPTTSSVIFEPSNTPSNLNIGQLQSILNNDNTNVVVQTGTGGSGTGDITVNGSISYTSSKSLTLSSYNNISFGSNSILNSGSGDVILRADNTGRRLDGVGNIIGKVTFSGGNVMTGGKVKIYYNPDVFGTQDSMYSGGKTPIAYMLINALGSSKFDPTGGTLTALSEFTNNNDDAALAENYALSKNINASASQFFANNSFQPIGGEAGNGNATFTGNFDGQGFVIDGLHLKSTSFSAGDYVGLFAFASSNIANSPITIENVGFTNAVVNSQAFQFAGVLAGKVDGYIKNVYSINGTVNGNSTIFVGGLVGVGSNIYDSYVSGGTVSSNSDFVGGLAGIGAIASNSYSSADVTGYRNVGGLFGEATAIDTITNSNSLISNSYATGNVSTNGSAGSTSIGGLVGVMYDGGITDSYATGNVSGGSVASNVGGLLGLFHGGGGAGITNTYSIGSVTGTTATKGGLIGNVDNFSGFSVTNSYWDSQKSGLLTSSNSSGTYKSGCFGSSCLLGGFDLTDANNYNFNTTWSNWSIIDHQSYPYLKVFNSSTPRVIAGTSSPSIGTNNSKVVLAVDGSIKQTGNAYADGSFYFLTANGSIPDNTHVLLYLDGIATKANIVAVVPTSGASLSGANGLTFIPNRVSLGSNLTSTMSNADLNTAKGGLSDTDILFSYNAGVLTLGNGTNPNVGINTTTTTTYTLDGNLTAGGTGSLVFNGPIQVSASNPQLITNAASGNVTINNTVTGNGSNSITINTAGTTSTITGVISNLSAFTKSGTGTLTLSGVNAYIGPTLINLGTLKLDATGIIPSTSDVSIANNATLDLANNSKTIGSLTGAIGSSVTLGSGTLTTNANVSGLASTTFSGIISGTGGLNKEGTGILILDHANSFTGTTKIDFGTLRLLGGTAIANSSIVNLALSGAVLDLSVGTSNSETIGSLTGVTGTSVTLGSNTLTAGNSTPSAAFAGAISGTGGFTKQGTGTITFSGTNTYSGTTTISAGKLQLQGGTALANNTLVDLTASGAILDISPSLSSETIGALKGVSGSSVTLGANTLTTGGSASSTFSGVISGTGTLTKTGATTFTLGGANTFTGTTTVIAGTLQFVAGGSLTGPVDLAVSGTTLDLNNISSSIGSLTGVTGSNVTLGSGTLTTGDGNNSQLDGVISGAGGVIKVGSGTFTLTGTNTYTGDTTVKAGTLKLQGGSALHDNNKVDLSNVGPGTAATLDISSASSSETIGSLQGATGSKVLLGANTLTTGGNGNSTIFSGDISGTNGGITKKGLTSIFTLAGTNTYTGTTTVNQGTLRLGNGSTISGNVDINSAGAILDLNNNSAIIASLTGVLGSQVTLGSGSLTTGDGTSTIFSGEISGTGNLTKQGSGKFTLAGINTYSGTTTVKAGTLELQGGNALDDNNSVNLSNVGPGTAATLEIDNSETIGSLQGASGSQLVLNANTLTTGGNNNDTTFHGVISGTGGITKKGTGTFTLDGINTYSGATNINTGILSLTNLSALGSSSSTTVLPGTGQTAALDINVSGQLANSNPINLTGTGIGDAGALTLTANDITLNNPINLADGQTKIGGNGTGTMIFNGNMNGGSTLTIALPNASIDLADITLSTLGDSLLVTSGGTITLNGTLTADIGDGNVSIELAGQQFVNNVGPTAINPGSGVFYIWSVDPRNDTRGGLTYSFKQYDLAYSSSYTQIYSGNGLFYSYDGKVTPHLIGPITKVYDATTLAQLDAGNYSTTGVIDQDTVVISTPDGTYDNKNVGTGKTVTSDTISLLSQHNYIDNADVYGYTLFQDTATFDEGEITAADLHVTNVIANSRQYDGTKSAPLDKTYATILPFAGDSVILNKDDAFGLFGNKNAGTNKDVIVFGFTISGAQAGNYNLIQPTGLTADVTPAPLTVTPNSISKTYGDDDPSGSSTNYQKTSGTLYGSDELTGAMGREVGEDVKTYEFLKKDVTVIDGNNGNNYALTFDTATNYFTITPRDTTANVANTIKTYGAGDPSIGNLNVTLYNIVNRNVIDMNGNSTQIDDTNKVSGSVTSLHRTAGELADNSYTITDPSFGPLTGVAAANYQAPTEDQDHTTFLTIEKKTLSATVANQSKYYGSNDPNIADITVSLFGIVDNSNIYTWNGDVSINDTDHVSGALTGLTRVAGENVSNSPYAILTADFALSGSAASNYNSVADFVGNPTLTIKPATVTVKANAESKFLGEPDPTFTYTDVGLLQHTVVDWMGNYTHVFGDLSGVLSRVQGQTAGVYPILLGSLSAGSNYTINYFGSLFTIINNYSDINTADINNQPLVNAETCTPQRVDAPILNSKCVAAYEKDYLNANVDAMLNDMTQYINALDKQANANFVQQNF